LARRQRGGFEVRYMRHLKFLQSTPLKLALIFSGLFLCASLVTGFSIYEIMRWEMIRHHSKAVGELYTSIAGNKADDDTDFLDTVEANIRAAHGHDRVILATKADGTVLAGNIPPIDLPDGWSTIPAYKLGLHGRRKYLLMAGTVRGDRLIVGQSYQDIDKLEAIAAAGFGWTFIIVIVMAFVGGSIIGKKAQRRFRAVQDTMDRISKGDLSARLPLLGRGDDIDQLSAHINGALRQLEATVEGMRQVSTDIAHDLKTPLNRLRITIDEARRELDRNDKARLALDTAASEIEQVNRTFDALLRISQLEARTRRKRFRLLDMNGILRETAELYDGALEEPRCSLALDLKAKGCMINGDRELLIQLWCNLIENAIRHGPGGTRMRIAASHSLNDLVVTMEDNGPGIPPEEREKVFRRLYRLERSRSTPGTGLGLSLVKAIAELHEASIRLEDAGPGLRVVIRFPVARSGSVPDIPSREEAAPGSTLAG
jgi:signal transduction histidine kinase